MLASSRKATFFSFACILGGLLLFANTQYTNVMPDPTRVEFGAPEPVGRPIGDATIVLLTASLIVLGALVIAGARTPARGWRRALAMTVLGSTLLAFLVINFSLFINGVGLTTQSDRAIYFTASYLFHTGRLWSFAGVYLLFMLTLVAVFLLLGSLGYLVAPGRFWKALWDRRDWGKNEAVHVAAGLLLLLSLSVFFVYLFRLAIDADFAAMRAKGPLAQNLVAVYYLLILLLFFLILSIAAHTFLVNWGTTTPLEARELLKSIGNVARVERTLLWSTVGINLFLLFAPTLESAFTLSSDPVFSLSPRGFSWFYFLILIPYLPYVISQGRLKRLLREGHPHVGQTPFSAQSLRLVQQFLTGISLITVVAIAARWEPLSVMLAFSSWTGGVLLVHALALRFQDGLPQPSFRTGAGVPLYFLFLSMAVTTGLMLWGAGNTFEILYVESSKTLQFVNEASFGEDLAARVGAATILAGSLVLTLHLLGRSVAVSRRFLGHYVWMFVITTVAATTTFTVGVWTAGPRELQDAYAGFAFRQYYGTERWLVGFLLTGAVLGLFWSLGKILRPILDRMNSPGPAEMPR